MSEQHDHRKCLLLNADYTPLRIISWQKAIIWDIRYGHNHNYGIEILSYYKDKSIIGTNNRQFKVPSVAKTIRFLNLYNKTISFSKTNILIRDDYTCQYCGDRYPRSQLTLDHIVPRSRITNRLLKTDWLNIVASCRRCNATKGNRTPKEANMPTIKQPIQPYFSTKYLPMFRNMTIIHDEWEPYLKDYINYENKS
jgi:5-methylcytosine-specific restriction endonuclease McrA